MEIILGIEKVLSKVPTFSVPRGLVLCMVDSDIKKEYSLSLFLSICKALILFC